MDSFLALFNLEPETDVEAPVVPMPMWNPAGGDLVPAPQRQIDRIIERAIRLPDGTMQFERETIYLRNEEPTPKPEGPYTIYTHYLPPGVSFDPVEQERLAGDVAAGRAVFIGGPLSPDGALRTQRQRRHGWVENGRIFLGD